MPSELRPGKDKGTASWRGRAAGLGRLRRAHAKDPGRARGLERHDEEVEDLAATGIRKSAHSGESLITRFNRVARAAGDGVGTQAEVCGFQGREIMVRFGDGHEELCIPRRLLAKMVGGEKHPLAIGDKVRVQDTTITAVLPRRNQLERVDSHNVALRQVIAANVDHLVIVASIADPLIKPCLIDRYLVIAHHAQVAPILVINKADLADTESFCQRYRSLGYPVFCTIAKEGMFHNDDGPALKAALIGRSAVFAGQSGVGKSCLVQALFPQATIRIGEVSVANQKGRHTTTASRSYLLDDGTVLMDTPGIRECALAGLSPVDVALHYRDLAPLQSACKFHDCSHRHEPGCAVKTAVETGTIHPERYDSYLSIVTEDLGLGP